MEVELPRRMELPMDEPDSSLLLRSHCKWLKHLSRKRLNLLRDADGSMADETTSSSEAASTISEHCSTSSSADAQ